MFSGGLTKESIFHLTGQHGYSIRNSDVFYSTLHIAPIYCQIVLSETLHILWFQRFLLLTSLAPNDVSMWLYSIYMNRKIWSSQNFPLLPVNRFSNCVSINDHRSRIAMYNMWYIIYINGRLRITQNNIRENFRFLISCTSDKEHVWWVPLRAL